jgi:hypothetical protein
MLFFKHIVNFIIESSIYVALSVYVLIRITFLKLNIPHEASVCYFGFFGTIVGYNFIKYDELARVKKVSLTPLFKTIILLSFISFLITLYYFMQLEFQTQIAGLIALLITVLYTLPFFPNKRNMRNWGGLKIYMVAIAWVGVTVILPVLNSDTSFDLIVLVEMLQRFLFVFLLLLIFEIIDLQFDDKLLNTFPQKMGVVQTKRLAYLMLFLFLVIDFLKFDIDLKQLFVTILLVSIIGVFAFFASVKRSKYYTAFWVESVPFFWWILLLVFR